MIPFITISYVQESENPYLWMLTEEIRVLLSDGKILTIPKGFVTDFASIPQVFWSVLPPIGPANIAFIIHDYLYQQRDERGRKFADDEMLFWMKKTKLEKWKRKVIYHVVRWKGSKYWKGKAGQYE